MFVFHGVLKEQSVTVQVAKNSDQCNHSNKLWDTSLKQVEFFSFFEIFLDFSFKHELQRN